MFGWCYGFSIDDDAPPITKPNLITGEGRARVRGLDKVEVLGDPDFDEYGTFITMEKEE